jgi:hypothetical protein
VKSIKIEGGCRKPEMNDLFIVQAVMFPMKAYTWLQTYHRRYISTEVRPVRGTVKATIMATGRGTVIVTVIATVVVIVNVIVTVWQRV